MTTLFSAGGLGRCVCGQHYHLDIEYTKDTIHTEITLWCYCGRRKSAKIYVKGGVPVSRIPSPEFELVMNNTIASLYEQIDQ